MARAAATATMAAPIATVARWLAPEVGVALAPEGAAEPVTTEAAGRLELVEAAPEVLDAVAAEVGAGVVETPRSVLEVAAASLSISTCP